MIEEVAHHLGRDREAKTFTSGDLHVGDTDDFAEEIEQWPAAVAGIDLRGGLQIKIATDLTRLGAEDALRDGALQTERAADGEHALTRGQRIRAADLDVLELRRVFVLDLQQREIGELVHGHDANLLVGASFELAVFLVINFDGNLRLAFDDVEVGDEKAVFVEEEPRTKPAGRADLNHGLAELIDEIAHVALATGFATDGINPMTDRRAGNSRGKLCDGRCVGFFD